MAKTSTIKAVIINNMPTKTVSKPVELVVVNDQFVPHGNEINPGVNSIYQ